MIRLSAEFPRLPGAYNRAFFAGLTSRDAVLLDGAEQLSLLSWFQLRWRTRRAGFLVVTTPRAGRLPLLHRCTTSPELLCELVSSLGQLLNADETVALYQRHRGNVRDALLELYDQRAKDSAHPLSFPALHA